MKAFLSALLEGPHDASQEFISGGTDFAELYALAGALHACFVEVEEKDIPICLAAEKREVIAAALLAALASGVKLVLPHSFSQAALLQMQEVTGFNVAVTDVARDFPDTTELLFTGSISAGAGLPVPDLDPDAELLLLFTGGSTGTPRVWSKTAANIFGEARFMADQYGLGRGDCIVATVTPCHIYGLLFSVVIPLLAAVPVAAETPSFPAEIADCVKEHAATVLVTVPAHYRIIRERRLHSTLRLAFSSAGMLEQKDNELFCETNAVGIVEVYGSTETGGLAARNRADGESFFTPLPPVSWKIAERRLLVKSPFLSPDLPRDEEGFFLSGDLVEQQGEAAFSLHGRADSVTKVGGERVDLDEVRAAVYQQPGVKECVVLALEDGRGRGSRIAALVRGEALEPDLLRSALAETLEPSARPKRILVVNEIPVAANGKYDRAAVIALLGGRLS